MSFTLTCIKVPRAFFFSFPLEPDTLMLDFQEKSRKGNKLEKFWM